MTNPFENKTWCRMCLRTGVIVPPPGDEIARVNKLVMWSMLIAVTVGAAVSWAAFLWK